MNYSIYFDRMILTSNSNAAYKYLWEDRDLDRETSLDLVKSGLIKIEEIDAELFFSSAEEAFSFIKREKNNFAHSDECVVIVNQK